MEHTERGREERGIKKERKKIDKASKIRKRRRETGRKKGREKQSEGVGKILTFQSIFTIIS